VSASTSGCCSSVATSRWSNRPSKDEWIPVEISLELSLRSDRSRVRRGVRATACSDRRGALAIGLAVITELACAIAS
jgi:hypothetical protein